MACKGKATEYRGKKVRQLNIEAARYLSFPGKLDREEGALHRYFACEDPSTLTHLCTAPSAPLTTSLCGHP